MMVQSGFLERPPTIHYSCYCPVAFAEKTMSGFQKLIFFLGAGEFRQITAYTDIIYYILALFLETSF